MLVLKLRDLGGQQTVMDYLSYLDAGTGSVIVQAVIGAVAGVGLFGRRAIANIKYKFKSAASNKGK